MSKPYARLLLPLAAVLAAVLEAAPCSVPAWNWEVSDCRPGSGLAFGERRALWYLIHISPWAASNVPGAPSRRRIFAGMLDSGPKTSGQARA